jgi:CCR4-NOT complex subunit CAF16
LSLNDVKEFPLFDEIKRKYKEQSRVDSPLTTLCITWLREDRDRHRNVKTIDPATGLPHSKWDEMSENMKRNGDKYYNYWKQ